MGYFIITDSNWAKLRNEILSLAETCHKAFEDKAGIPIGCTTGMCAGCSTPASVPCGTIVIRVSCPLPKSGISATTSVMTWNSCSKQKQRKLKREKLKSTNRYEDYGAGKRFEYRGGRYAGGAVSYQRSKQEN